MLDFFTASVIFFVTMFAVQEWLLVFRLGYLGRYWTLMSGVSLTIAVILSSFVIIPLIVNSFVNVLSISGNLIIGAYALLVLGAILWLGQWLILRPVEITPRIFALINTILGILVYSLLFWFNRSSMGWSGNPIEGWRPALIFLGSGAATGAIAGKALDFYCWLLEQRLLQLEREQIEKQAKEKERLELEAQEKQRLEQQEMAERKRIQREMALEEERKWYEEHGQDYQDYEDYEDEDESE